MAGYIILIIFIFILGIVIGSFLNVCIIRIPKHETIVTVPSHCMTCGYNLKWYDNIPLFSYIFLKGKCRKCGAHISVQYPIIEAVNGVMYVLIFVRFILFGDTANALREAYGTVSFADLILNLSYADIVKTVIYCLLFSALLVLTLIDWRTYEIPVGINIFILVLGIINLVLVIISGGKWLDYVIGLFAVSVPLLLILLISKGRAIGGGDVKLMGAAGLLLGWQHIVLAFVLGCIIGSIIHITRMKVSGEGKVLAMGPYLSAGIMITIFFGDFIINAYLRLIGLA